MTERYIELLASSLIILAQKMKKDYTSDNFANILIEDIGFHENEVEDIIEIMDEMM